MRQSPNRDSDKKNCIITTNVDKNEPDKISPTVNWHCRSTSSSESVKQTSSTSEESSQCKTTAKVPTILTPPTRSNTKIYVGRLPSEINNEMLFALFNPFGTCISIRTTRDPNFPSDPYAFIEFQTHEQANLALNAMNQRTVMGKELRINWAIENSSIKIAQNAATVEAGGYQIYVGELMIEIEDDDLKQAFGKFGEILDSRVMRFEDGKSRGFGFISFLRESDAESAITKMNGVKVGSKAIKVNWATRQLSQTNYSVDKTCSTLSSTPGRPYDDVVRETPETNATVYVGGIKTGLSKVLLQEHFQEFGPIVSIRVFPDHGNAFINYSCHFAAARAISKRFGYEINGYKIKASWGKDILYADNIQPNNEEIAGVQSNNRYNSAAILPKNNFYNPYAPDYSGYSFYPNYHQWYPNSYNLNPCYSDVYQYQSNVNDNFDNYYNIGNQSSNSEYFHCSSSNAEYLESNICSRFSASDEEYDNQSALKPDFSKDYNSTRMPKRQKVDY